MHSAATCDRTLSPLCRNCKTEGIRNDGSFISASGDRVKVCQPRITNRSYTYVCGTYVAAFSGANWPWKFAHNSRQFLVRTRHSRSCGASESCFSKKNRDAASSLSAFILLRARTFSLRTSIRVQLGQVRLKFRLGFPRNYSHCSDYYAECI